MSDNELDAELLALAGDDSSSDEEEVKSSARESRSPSPKAKNSANKQKSPPRRGVAQKSRSRGARKSKRDDSEEEEGEA